MVGGIAKVTVAHGLNNDTCDRKMNISFDEQDAHFDEKLFHILMTVMTYSCTCFWVDPAENTIQFTNIIFQLYHIY